MWVFARSTRITHGRARCSRQVSRYVMNIVISQILGNRLHLTHGIIVTASITPFLQLADQVNIFLTTDYRIKRRRTTTVVAVTGITGWDITVDVTEVDTSRLGHNYFGGEGRMINELRSLLHGPVPIEQRTWLRKVLHPSGDTHWWVLQDAPISP